MSWADGWGRMAGSVRVRTTLAATLIVAVTLAVGSTIVLSRFRASLDHNRRNAAVARAEDIASLATSGRLPTVLALPNQDATYAQVIDASGHVLAGSANIAGEHALGPPVPLRSAPVVRSVLNSPIDGDAESRLVAVPAGSPAQPLTVFAGYSLVGNDFAVNDIRLALLVGLPVLVLVMSGTTWLLVGRALRPIEAIRSEVAEITTLGSRRRVPEPASRDEIARLAATMNTMLDRLEASHDKQKAFVADASHELRSPLASLRAQLEIGLAGGQRTDWESTVAGALAEEARIEAMVRDLLLLARLDRDTAIARPGAGTPPVDLGAVAAAEIGARPDRPGVTIRCDTRCAAPVRMPEELVRRLVANLLDNAQRHATARVDVAIDADGRWAELAVQDDGPGIEPGDRERVFERFTRLDPARSTEDGGAGLGLAIVKDIVAIHGGTVGFIDCDRGARIVVRLPSGDPPAGPPGPPIPAAAAAAT